MLFEPEQAGQLRPVRPVRLRPTRRHAMRSNSQDSITTRSLIFHPRAERYIWLPLPQSATQCRSNGTLEGYAKRFQKPIVLTFPQILEHFYQKILTQKIPSTSLLRHNLSIFSKSRGH